MSRNNKKKSKAPETSQFFHEREELSSSLTSENITDSTVSNETNSGGRNLSPVWKYFSREKTNSYGHFSAKCDLCPAKWARGEPAKLEAHLALECPNVEDEVQQLYLRRIACRDDLEDLQLENPANLKKRKLSNKQPNLKRYFPQKADENLSEERIKSINSSLLKAFVVCGISFSTIENPFFIDFLYNLCPNYHPPSREVLSGRLLDQEYSRVTIKHEILVKILSPIRTAITNLEAQSTTLADCFLQFIQLAAAIKKISNLRVRRFKNYCIQSFNKRWRGFDRDTYLLAYFLHPGYRETEYNNLEIVKRFDIENIVCLRDEIFQDNEFDTDSEESPDGSTNNSDNSDNESVVSNKTGQGVFDFDPMNLATDLMQEWSYENDNNSLDRADNCANNNPNAIDKEDVNENSSTVDNDNENSESLPIALRKTCRNNKQN
ncbi:23444_t:CDS:2 [Cetraspora pellucida]|uniref:23444_t:CDS:1 n=1 Tax=Cetraspora pellucida TaxID=1433469 RepID=A0A9N9GZH9_9GLOM|nr:23444_t:CDS:2 [Cetraspora pellucida]